MSPKLTANRMISEGLQEVLEAEREAAKALLISQGCHCCCCTGECTGAFENSTEQQQQAWLANYWENVNAEAERDLIRL